MWTILSGSQKTVEITALAVSLTFGFYGADSPGETHYFDCCFVNPCFVSGWSTLYHESFQLFRVKRPLSEIQNARCHLTCSTTTELGKLFIYYSNWCCRFPVVFIKHFLSGFEYSVNITASVCFNGCEIQTYYRSWLKMRQYSLDGLSLMETWRLQPCRSNLNWGTSKSY